jgi:hypothetical protein
VERPPSEERRFRSDVRAASRDRGLAVYGAALVVLAAPLLIGSGPPWAQLLSSALVFGAVLLFVLTRRLSVRVVPLALPAALAAVATALLLYGGLVASAISVGWCSTVLKVSASR